MILLGPLRVDNLPTACQGYPFWLRRFTLILPRAYQKGN